ncbi:protein-disulfide reductase DsbD family protein [Hirschia litorea]|uniref:Protein-disulfide reductase DsbD family protein n=1 Tax=Hirschia litorea TaxID=1199156 RepID=A0ABW2IJC2_9PROT
MISEEGVDVGLPSIALLRVRILYMRAFISFLAVLMSMMTGLTANADPVDAGNATVEIISERKSIAPGDRFLAALKLDIDEGWHVYWRNAGDAGIAPSINWNVTGDAQTGEFYWPAPHTIPLETLMNYGYEDQLVLPFEIIAPDNLQAGDMLVMAGKAEYQICLDICIWEDADIDLVLPVSDMPEASEENGRLIAAALEASPVDMTGQASTTLAGEDTLRLSIADDAFAATLEGADHVRFYPYEHEIEHFPEQNLRVGPNGGTLDLQLSSLTKIEPMPIEGIVVVDQKDGSRFAMKVAAQAGEILAGTDETSVKTTHKEGVSIAPVAGIGQILTWLGLAFAGGLILNLMPCVLPVLTIKANGLAHAAQKGESHLKSHGIGYLAGVLTCFIAIGIVLLVLRAAGEQAGLGFQLQYPPMVLGLALLMYLVGLNLLGVFEIGSSVMGVGSNLANKSGVAGAFFTGLLAAVVGAPCVGPLLAASLGAVVSQPAWVVLLFLIVMGAGLAAPFVLLSFVPGLAKAMPKPGMWMDIVKQVLAFPMFLTAIWLLWVFAGQKGVDSTIIVLTAAVAIGFVLWLVSRPNANKLVKVLGALLLIVSFVSPFVLTGGTSTSLQSASTSVTTKSGVEVKTGDWSPEYVEELRAAGTPIFVDFTARWCVTCQMNKRTSLHHDKVKEAFAEQGVVFLTADWTNRNEIIANELARHKRAGVPLYLYYPPEGDVQILPQILTAGLVVKTVTQ